jgi:hypothetical protein
MPMPVSETEKGLETKDGQHADRLVSTEQRRGELRAGAADVRCPSRRGELGLDDGRDVRHVHRLAVAKRAPADPVGIGTRGRNAGPAHCPNEALGLGAVERHRSEGIATAPVEDDEVRVQQGRSGSHEVVENTLGLGGSGGQRPENPGRRALPRL